MVQWNASSYLTPHQQDMECGCQNVGPFLYHPNAEEGAEFVCEGWHDYDYKKDGR